MHIHTCKNPNTSTREFMQSYGDIKAVQNKTIYISSIIITRLS